MATEFGDLLKKKRKEAGLTQRELADRAGVDFSYISKIENGRLPPPAADTLVQLCKIMHVPPEELLALMRKIPTQVQQTISSSAAAQDFLRKAQRMKLTDVEWNQLAGAMRGLRESS